MTATLFDPPDDEPQDARIVRNDEPQDSQDVVAKLWSFCNLLRDAGMSTIDYVEQLTFLLFLKMAHEQSTRGYNPDTSLAEVGDYWQQLYDTNGDDLEVLYRHILEALATKPGTLGVIFRKAQNKVQNPALLERLIKELIGAQNWSREHADVKGDAYEGLLAKGAEDSKTGAGQYFTPRALISAMVECVRPGPDDTIIDPACGTGGFLLAARDYIQDQHGRELPGKQRTQLEGGAISGVELVDGTARLAAMNMLLHGIGRPDGASLIDVRDALADTPKKRASVVLANPPFGRKSSITVNGGEDNQAYSRPDFWVTGTTNKQLNFVQHITALLAIDGRAAVVLPDNVLFEGGAGETIRRRLLREFDVHTLLRLPTGIFYAGGVKANVLFFDKKRPREQPWTTRLWVYDFRTDEHFTLRQNQLSRAHLDDFVACFSAEDRTQRTETERFKAFDYDELLARDKVNLDITWRREADEGSDTLAPPEEIATQIVADLQAALNEFTAIADTLRPNTSP